MPVSEEHASGGPYYLALSDTEEPNFGPEHQRYDEYVFSFSYTQDEGDFAILTLEIRNPYKGLYAPGQKIFCWFTGDDIKPFRGRMIGIPSSLLGEVITIEFTSRPSDARAQKIALAETMRVLPMYDPVFVDAASLHDPEVVLEGYSELWHWDPATHDLSSSDILVGDETIEFASNLYDNVEITLEDPPLQSLDYEAQVNWSQQAAGTINFGNKTFNSYTSSTIANGWPKPGTGLQAGWSVAGGTVVNFNKSERRQINIRFTYQNQQKKHNDGDVLSINESKSGVATYEGDIAVRLSTKESRINGDAQTGRGASASIETTDAIIAGPSTVTAGLVLKYEADRKREETLKIHLVADIQPVLHDDDGEVEDPETVSGVDVGIPIIESDSDSDAPDDTIPLDDPSRFSYFATDRGLQSVKHIICRMRQKLLFSARAARVSWDCPLGEATGISLRKNAVLRDPRIAGGEAIGKIISYELSGNGDSGEFVAHVTMACAVGNNTAIELSPGSDDVYEDDCFEADCFEHIDQVISALPADDVGFTPPSVSSAGELLFPLDKGQVLVREQIINSVEEQKAAIDDTTPTALDLSNSQGQNMVAAIEAMTQKYFEELQNAIKSKVQKYELELKPVTGGPFTREYIVAPTILSIPKQIDLSAT